jgi:DNA polymerase III subunit epsilon
MNSSIDLQLDTPVCFIDFETTGVDVLTDQPIEFGAVLVDKHGVIEKKLQSRIMLENISSFNKEAVKIHGIKYESLKHSPTQKQVLSFFFEEFGYNYCFGAWNANFDVSFFKKMCHENRMSENFNKIHYRHLDVQSVAKLSKSLGIIDKNIKSLSDCAEYFNISRSSNHNALEDALICCKVYGLIYSKFTEAIIHNNTTSF